VNQKTKQNPEICPECGNDLTIFCVVPIENESDIPIHSGSENTYKRYCPKCEHEWPIE
jgi:ribosomal protein S27AE